MRFDVREQYATQFGEVCSAALDLEQSDAEMILEAGDGVADGRLGTVELFGRRRETALLDDGLQDLPFIESGSHVDKYIYQIDMEVQNATIVYNPIR